MKEATYLLVDQDALPEVFPKVIRAKQLLMNGEASSTSEAVRMAGISRSVFYKYKDAVYPYNSGSVSRIITVQAILNDKPGVLMSLASVFYNAGANILTINQNIPVGGKAVVSISARVDNITGTVQELLSLLAQVEGVQSIHNISDE
ncbi:MAG TPA: ACT domain-containing protein [Candidatus Gallacutalibacter pullicola]|uniref:ACT domain-containing protein n=1 Tax=Candidatus Gallacutalibacter pullicola TaxID=2840830 RepID=A0A9D1J297_9FIRM|nr:ACT domain-containing protein [Candidatus Gallacutalibacter pullicola]